MEKPHVPRRLQSLEHGAGVVMKFSGGHERWVQVDHHVAEQFGVLGAYIDQLEEELETAGEDPRLAGEIERADKAERELKNVKAHKNELKHSCERYSADIIALKKQQDIEKARCADAVKHADEAAERAAGKETELLRSALAPEGVTNPGILIGGKYHNVDPAVMAEIRKARLALAAEKKRADEASALLWESMPALGDDDEGADKN